MKPGFASVFQSSLFVCMKSTSFARLKCFLCTAGLIGGNSNQRFLICSFFSYLLRIYYVSFFSFLPFLFFAYLLNNGEPHDGAHEGLMIAGNRISFFTVSL